MARFCRIACFTYAIISEQLHQHSSVKDSLQRFFFPSHFCTLKNAQDVSLPGSDEQERILADASNSIKRHAFSMRKAIDEENMREALRFSAAMLGELRTSQLSPQKYYELYMLAFDQMVNLEVGGSEASRMAPHLP